MSRSVEFAAFVAHSMTRRYITRLIYARRLISEAFKKGTPHVALSGGKDSTVVYELACSIDRNVPAVWSDDIYYLPETKAYMDNLCLSGSNLHHIRTNAKHRDWFTTSGDYDGVADYARRELDSDVVLLGLRKEENNYRRAHLNKHGCLFFAESTQMWHCNPIANWTAMDVWAYIASSGCLYNHAYDKLAEAGVQLERQRIGPFATERATEYGALAIIRRLWPAEYSRFVAAHPEAWRFT